MIFKKGRGGAGAVQQEIIKKDAQLWERETKLWEFIIFHKQELCLILRWIQERAGVSPSPKETHDVVKRTD